MQVKPTLPSPNYIVTYTMVMLESKLASILTPNDTNFILIN